VEKLQYLLGRRIRATSGAGFSRRTTRTFDAFRESRTAAHRRDASRQSLDAGAAASMDSLSALLGSGHRGGGGVDQNPWGGTRVCRRRPEQKRRQF